MSDLEFRGLRSPALFGRRTGLGAVMSGRCRYLLAAALFGGSLAAAAPPLPESPQTLFKDLFVAVQSARIFPDGKTFADAVPKGRRRRSWRAITPSSRLRQALKAFVDAHFALPSQATAPAAVPSIVPIDQHIDRSGTP